MLRYHQLRLQLPYSLLRIIDISHVAQGLSFKEGARDDCAAAVAIVLFGNSDTVLPGGYKGQETSPDSPIAQVAEFPSEFILLGRATVMIKVIE